MTARWNACAGSGRDVRATGAAGSTGAPLEVGSHSDRVDSPAVAVKAEAQPQLPAARPGAPGSGEVTVVAASARSVHSASAVFARAKVSHARSGGVKRSLPAMDGASGVGTAVKRLCPAPCVSAPAVVGGQPGPSMGGGPDSGAIVAAQGRPATQDGLVLNGPRTMAEAVAECEAEVAHAEAELVAAKAELEQARLEWPCVQRALETELVLRCLPCCVLCAVSTSRRQAASDVGRRCRVCGCLCVIAECQIGAMMPAFCG